MKTGTFTACLAAAVLFAGVANATIYTEVGDAGQIMATSQVTSGTGSLTTIQGKLSATYLRTDADMYRIHLDGGAFTARTIGPEFLPDPMLYLFNLSGTRLLFNDDYIGLQSYIHSPLLAEGDYYLAISEWPNPVDPFSGSSGYYEGQMTYNIGLEGASYATSVPEPSTVLLLGAGLAGVGFARRRAQKKSA